MKNKIAITTTTFAEYDHRPLEILLAEGYEVVTNKSGKKIEKKDLLEVCSGSIGIIAGTEKYDSDVLQKLRQVKVISRCGTGIENIDMKSALDLGIKVVNTPDAPTQAVAEFTAGLMLSLLRKIPGMNGSLKKAKWKKEMGNLIYGKKVGIIGFGRIGQRVAKLLGSFGAEIAYFDILPQVSSAAIPFMKKDVLLKWADIVTLHCTPSSKGKKVIGRNEMLLMKENSWLINTSRGELLDEKELYGFLKQGKLSAAIDVFEQEPYNGPLAELDNVILTPHVGSYAKESRIAMEIEAVENLLENL